MIEQPSKKQSLMSRLKNIQIEGPADFAANVDLYISGEKQFEGSVIEDARREIERSQSQSERLGDLVDELGQLFDELEQLTKDQMPQWWEANNPLAKIKAELDGWQPARVWQEGQANAHIECGDS